MKVLIEFTHGLGDCVQFTSVLKHIRKYKPDWEVTLNTREGKETVGVGLCNEFTSKKMSSNKFSKTIKVRWHESSEGHTTMPSTKVEKCLREEFQIPTDKELLNYEQQIRPEALVAASKYLDEIGVKYGNACILHYEGNTSGDRKNLNHDLAKIVCDYCVSRGITPIILDWDRRSSLPNNSTIFCPDASNPLWKTRCSKQS